MDYQTTFESFFHMAADTAGKIALSYFRQSFSIDEKADASPVTQADREIELAFRALVNRHYPHHGVVGEEFGADNAGAPFTWVIDPIDGTKSFAMGRPLFGTLIALVHDGVPVAGLIDQPFTHERWLAFKGAGARFNGTAIRVAEPRPLAAARCFAGGLTQFEGRDLDRVLHLGRSVKWPQFGCDCYAYGLVAMGCADFAVERDLKWHDVAALLPLLTEAGGTVQSWGGTAVQDGWDGTLIAASSAALAAEAAAFMSGVLPRPQA